MALAVANSERASDASDRRLFRSAEFPIGSTTARGQCHKRA
jgi:hypothetical protein